MYICPTCGKEFPIDTDMAKHYLKCWKEKNPYYKSKDAPRSADITTSQMNVAMENFFAQFVPKE